MLKHCRALRAGRCSAAALERAIRRADMPSARSNGLSITPEELEVGPDPQGVANLLA
jgi:hypothetical protein